MATDERGAEVPRASVYPEQRGTKAAPDSGEYSKAFGPQNSASGTDFLAGGGEMGKLIRSMDWSKTPLGLVETWPQSLRSAVSILLPSKAQIVLFWGRELITLYNDAYRPVFGAKHPRALGLPVHESWSELWGAGLRELFEGVLTTGEAYWASDRPFFIERFGYPEETFFDVSYDPVRDETGQVGGLFCIVSETTARVVGERRLKTLRELSARTTEEARSAEEACRTAAHILAGNRHDLPFALIYLLDADAKSARLAGSAGLSEGSPAALRRVDLTALDVNGPGWPLRAVLDSGRAGIVTEPNRRFRALPGGVWPESPHTALVLPVKKSGQDRLAGFLVAGVSPRRPLDDHYRGFFDLLASQIATAVANARAYEGERKRAEALTELDRAKTEFFSNVSHEFRTPLTLMLGPIDDLLNQNDLLPQQAVDSLTVVHRNSVRLLKLVNTLLDFSRIEAGRVQALYEPTDLAVLTIDLASVFRSAVEKAGMRLIVDCPPLAEKIYVDRDMWEKIVLNMLSNAFKYTFEGQISVRLVRSGDNVVLTVADTGTGIEAEELPRMFERFHRIHGARGRTHEGTGIGLALVQELVKLHGGAIHVESEYGKGSSFIVSIPCGKSHLPADRIGVSKNLSSMALGTAQYLQEAIRWLPAEGSAESKVSVESDSGPLSSQGSALGTEKRSRIVLADDNVDMREYVRRLLSARYEVEAVADGQAALAAVRKCLPDLVLTDIMMPGLDGFGLLQQLRADSMTCTVPVILLSARAGEESQVEGWQAGADDYLIKPFSARELLARVGAHLDMARLRREADERERRAAEVLRQSEERYRRWVDTNIIGSVVSDMVGSVLEANEAYLTMVGYSRDDLDAGVVRWSDMTPPEYRDLDEKGLAEARARGACTPYEKEFIRKDGSRVPVIIGYALYQGSKDVAICFVLDLTDRKRQEREIQSLNRALTQKVADYEKAVRDLERYQQELQEKLADLEKFEEVVIGRELKMIELEKEVQRLREELKRIS